MNGRVDAVVLDFAPARAYVAMYPQLVITSDVLSEEEYGIAVRKEDTDLLEFINSVLRNMKKSPYDLLVEKWFSE
ncbi:MAG: arginine/lysine/histidine transporter system substrate-binding protein [Thermotogota bacterium]|nr:arginine/lysine/histidine transporter system substrate-binding protein [Thermotogota bacterium]